VWGTGPTDVYAAGEDGVLFRYNGSTWTALDSHTTQILLGLSGTAGSGCSPSVEPSTIITATP
jgi:hypothetical protein